LIVMMDPQGEVRSGPNALMLRTSWPGGMMCNMSRGGGLTPVAILDPARTKRSIEDSLYPEPKQVEHIGRTERAAVRSFLEQLNQLIDATSPGGRKSYGLASRCASTQRRVMHQLGLVNRPLMAKLREYEAGKVTDQEMHRELVRTRDRLLAGDGVAAAPVQQDIQQLLA
jgi:hypothetical protein